MKKCFSLLYLINLVFCDLFNCMTQLYNINNMLSKLSKAFIFFIQFKTIQKQYEFLGSQTEKDNGITEQVLKSREEHKRTPELCQFNGFQIM